MCVRSVGVFLTVGIFCLFLVVAVISLMTWLSRAMSLGFD